jgi:hypothetical protein
MNICKNKQYCLSEKTIEYLAEACNNYTERTKITNKKIKTGNFRDTVMQLHDVLNDACQQNRALSKQELMNNIVTEMKSLIRKRMIPRKGPANSNEWLSTDDINIVLEPLEIIVPYFKYIGATPADCSEYQSCDWYKLDYDNFIDNGIYVIAGVFNKDVFGMSGSHWVALYIDLRQHCVWYIDSAGSEPNAPIKKTIDYYVNYSTKKGYQPKYIVNHKKYQFDRTECGVYSCNAIIRMLSGETFESVINNPLSTKDITSCRKIYFDGDGNAHPKCDPFIINNYRNI